MSVLFVRCHYKIKEENNILIVKIKILFLSKHYFSELKNKRKFQRIYFLPFISSRLFTPLTFQTPKFSANHIIICFWDYIAKVVMLKVEGLLLL